MGVGWVSGRGFYGCVFEKSCYWGILMKNFWDG